jgi:hypothetical protein
MLFQNTNFDEYYFHEAHFILMFCAIWKLTEKNSHEFKL